MSEKHWNVIKYLPFYTCQHFYRTARSHSSTKLHAVSLLPNYTQSLLPNTNIHSATILNGFTLLQNYRQSLFYQTARTHSLPNYTQSLYYQTTPSHSSTKLAAVSPTKINAVTHAVCSTVPCFTPQHSTQLGSQFHVSAAFRCPEKCRSDNP